LETLPLLTDLGTHHSRKASKKPFMSPTLAVTPPHPEPVSLMRFPLSLLFQPLAAKIEIPGDA